MDDGVARWAAYVSERETGEVWIMESRDTKKEGKRITVDLTPAATAELSRLRDLTGLTIADLFRHALTLLRIYVAARQKGQEIRIVDPDSKDAATRLELPFAVSGS